jgi:predicted ATPase
MYISEIKLENIKSLRKATITFPTDAEAGWHVFIGDNSTGKSTLVRAIALALLGKDEAMGLRINWNEWLHKEAKTGYIGLALKPVQGEDKSAGQPTKKQVLNGLKFTREDNQRVEIDDQLTPAEFGNKHLSTSYANKGGKKNYNWGGYDGWFSAAFGPFRRFSGGNSDWPKTFYAQPKLGAHLSVFGEDVALSETIVWLRDLDYKALKNKDTAENEAKKMLDAIVRLINSEHFLPHNTRFHSITPEGLIQFKDAQGVLVGIDSLSDGFRSILSLTFELLRQLVRVYGSEAVFKHIYEDEMEINVSGVVIIDEIDAHLHPVWQTKIGNFFLKFFPKIQFIVTTHSPLVCRAAEKGSIWRLSMSYASDTSFAENLVTEVLGEDKKQLLYGNILDAYGTTLFGKEPVQHSPETEKELMELGRLNMLESFGKITEDQRQRKKVLMQKYPTNYAADFSD